MTDKERSMLFVRGFGDGAKGSAYKHPDQPDYMAGWKKGAAKLTIATIRYENANGLVVDHSPLRDGGGR